MQEHYKKIANDHKRRKHLTKGVDVIKLIFYNLMTEYYSKQYEFVKSINEISITVVNEMFSCHNDQTLLILATHKDKIEEGIAHLHDYNPDLITPFTDALIVALEAQTVETGRPPYDFEATIQNAINRGFFDETRGNPRADSFLGTTEKLVKKYDLN